MTARVNHHIILVNTWRANYTKRVLRLHFSETPSLFARSYEGETAHLIGIPQGVLTVNYHIILVIP